MRYYATLVGVLAAMVAVIIIATVTLELYKAGML